MPRNFGDHNLIIAFEVGRNLLGILPFRLEVEFVLQGFDELPDHFLEKIRWPVQGRCFQLMPPTGKSEDRSSI